MAIINAINNRTYSLTVDPETIGDSFIQFAINSTDKFRIGIDDTDDLFHISQGSALGTNDTFVMTTAGERTMPLQPALSRRPKYGSSQVNKTGDGTYYQYGPNSYGEISPDFFDQGSNMSTAGVITSPVTGRYEIIFRNQMSASAAEMGATDEAILQIITSNRTYSRLTEVNSGNIHVNRLGRTVTIFADMDAADTATFWVMYGGGTRTIDCQTSTNPRTLFCAHLVC